MEKRCIIVSGGRPGPAPQPQPGDFVIACDRGYRYCAGLGLQPDLFIGDFDSYDGAVDPAVPVERLQPEKDDTDTGHAIRHALDQGYRTLILVCALGGRLDHTLANIQNAASAAAEGANVTILDEREEITFLTGGTLRLPRRKGWGLSVFFADGSLHRRLPARGQIPAGGRRAHEPRPPSASATNSPPPKPRSASRRAF